MTTSIQTEFEGTQVWNIYLALAATDPGGEDAGPIGHE